MCASWCDPKFSSSAGATAPLAGAGLQHSLRADGSCAPRVPPNFYRGLAWGLVFAAVLWLLLTAAVWAVIA